MKRIFLLVMIFSLITLNFLHIKTPKVKGQAGGINLAILVFVGDSLMSGFQNGALHQSSQQNALSKGVFSSVKGLPRATEVRLVLPLIEEPGFPSPDASSSRGLLVQQPDTCSLQNFDLAIGKSSGRINVLERATNVAVPGQTMKEALEVKWDIDPNNPTTVDTFEDVILGFPYVLFPSPLNVPGSQVDVAVSLGPSYLILWLGTTDILRSALSGTVTESTLTSSKDFETAAMSVFSKLGRTGTFATVMNIPDITSFPYFCSEPELERLTGLSTKQVKKMFGVKKTDYVKLSAFPTIKAIMNGTTKPKLPENMVLTAKEIKLLQKATQQFNDTLTALTKRNNWLMLDVNSLFKNYQTNGVDIANVGKLTGDFFGGLFDIDGIHLTTTGQALLANEVIRASLPVFTAVDTKFPDVSEVARQDLQICQGLAGKKVSLDDLVKIFPAARSTESVLVERKLNP